VSDFVDELISADVPVVRDVTYGDNTGKVWFRKISAGERAALLKGQRFQARPGERGVIDLDLGDTLAQQMMLVQFSVCREDGSPVFKSLDVVKKIGASRINVLYEHASIVNEEAPDPGKS